MSRETFWHDECKKEEAKNEELTAKIAELERRTAMLTDAAETVCKKLESETESVTSLDMWKLRSALSETSADYEAWLQAEIVKRLGEPKAWIRHHINDRSDDYNVHLDWNKLDAERWVAQYKKGFAWLEPLYSSPLATPEERIKEGRI